MSVLLVALRGTRIDHPLLLAAVLAWSAVAFVAVFYLGMLPTDGDSPARLRRRRRLQGAVFLSFFVAIGAFFALGITGVHNPPR